VGKTIGGVTVETDIPVYHVKVGGVAGMKFGVPDVYAAIEWAVAYKDFLADWSKISRSLSRYSWSYGAGKKKVSSIKSKLGTTIDMDNQEHNPAAVTASTAILPEGQSMLPINKQGASLSPADGRWLRAMVGSATDIPDTILGADPDMGNLATAKTLDRPTELAMGSRQKLWADVFRDILFFVEYWSVKAPSGKLEGTITEEDGRILIELGLDPEVDPLTGKPSGEPLDSTIDVSFPPILEPNVREAVDAIVIAQAGAIAGGPAVGLLPPRETSRLLMLALGMENIDVLLDELYPPGEDAADQAPGQSSDAPTPAPPSGEEVQPTEAVLLHEAVNELRSVLQELMAA
jgi:hypothetical protein